MRRRSPCALFAVALFASCNHSRSGSNPDGSTGDNFDASSPDDCPGCPKFPDLDGPSCGDAARPTLVYPPDGVLLPPNMNVIEIQFAPGSGTTFFEIDLEKGSTDVRLPTLCRPIKDSRGLDTGG